MTPAEKKLFREMAVAIGGLLHSGYQKMEFTSSFFEALKDYDNEPEKEDEKP